jgi:hypothetical protein
VSLGYSLNELMSQLRAAGVRRLYLKRLAANDNSKNQVYLGQGFSALNILPAGAPVEERDGKTGRSRYKAPIRFVWLAPNGAVSPAPAAQLILYPQYPEVRFSGFLRGVSDAPGELMASREPGRLLFFGVRDDGSVVGRAAGPRERLSVELNKLAALPQVGVFLDLARLLTGADSRAILLSELRRISLIGWIDSKTLGQHGLVRPCLSSNCGGLTLEAELGITPNGFAEPDYLGWEVKQHGVDDFANIDAGVLTLMTPEPTSGFYRDRGVEAFVRRFGYPDKLGRPDRINFGGIHRIGNRVSSTGLTMKLHGYNSSSHLIEDLGKGGIGLYTDTDDVAAFWPFIGMMAHWSRKHALAAYVPSLSRVSPKQYRYGPRVRLGEQTDFLLFLSAMEAGYVYYDPGIKVEAASSSTPKVKRRSQFRVASKNLVGLYKSITTVDL